MMLGGKVWVGVTKVKRFVIYLGEGGQLQRTSNKCTIYGCYGGLENSSIYSSLALKV